MMTFVARTQWLSAVEMRAWLAYITTSSDLQRAIERDLEPFGLDGGDYQLLAMLSDAPDGRMKMCDLADTLRLSRSGLTRRMDGVLRKKLVERVQSENDKRVAYAVLTRKGMDLLKRVAPHHVASVREKMIDRLSDTEIRALATAFEKISAGLNEAH
jgi:DNA-binding MarR family transcriptional regulator